MNTPRFSFPGTAFLIIILLAFAVNSFGFTSNNDISVTRQMPSSAIAGETITVEITVDIGTGISDFLRGFYFTDEVPGDLTVESGLTSVTLNGSDLTEVIQEIGTAGEVYPAAVPYRILLEIPPDYNEDNYLTAGDELVILYDVTVPNDAIAGTVYTFPAYSWVGRILSNPVEEVFGHEDEPESILEVISETTTTSSAITSTTTTSVQSTTSSSSSTTTSAQSTTSSSSSTTTSIQPTTSSSSSTTTTATGSSSSTTTIGETTTTAPIKVTTSIVPEEYLVTVSPANVSVDSYQTVTLNAKTTLYGQEIQGCIYEWKIEPASTIKSTVDQGIFKTGLNLTGSVVTEQVTVTDVSHNSVMATATISVKPEILQGTIAGIFPKQLFRSRWLPVFYLLFIVGNETRFDPSSIVSLNDEDGAIFIDQTIVETMFGFGNLMVAFIRLEPGVQSGMVDLIVTTGEGDNQFSVVAKDAINIKLFGF